jgi:hypothetical protein
MLQAFKKNIRDERQIIHHFFFKISPNHELEGLWA